MADRNEELCVLCKVPTLHNRGPWPEDIFPAEEWHVNQVIFFSSTANWLLQKMGMLMKTMKQTYSYFIAIVGINARKLIDAAAIYWRIRYLRPNITITQELSNKKMKLHTKIDSLKNVGPITSDILILMHEIKNLGNKVAHEFALGDSVGDQGKRDILIKLRVFLPFFIADIQNAKEKRCLHFFYNKVGCNKGTKCTWSHK